MACSLHCELGMLDRRSETGSVREARGPRRVLVELVEPKK